MRTITVAGPPRTAALMARALASGRRRGASLPDVEALRRGVRVDRAHLAAYDRVCRFAVRDRLPSPYLHVLTFGLQLAVMAEPDFPLALPGLVHVANRLELARPVTADERLELSVRAQGLRPHPRGQQVDLVGTARVEGELVWRGRSTYLAKDEGSSEPSPSALDRPASVRFADDATPTARYRLPKDLGRRYAAVSGDINPIHLNPLAAKAFGFPRTIAHGMWSLARCLSALESKVAPAHVADVEFRGPVLLPGTVELRTRAVREGGFDVQLVSSARAGRQRSEHLRGTIRPC